MKVTRFERSQKAKEHREEARNFIRNAAEYLDSVAFDPNYADKAAAPEQDEAVRLAIHAFFVRWYGECVHRPDKGYGAYAQCDDPDECVPIRRATEVVAALATPPPVPHNDPAAETTRGNVTGAARPSGQTQTVSAARPSPPPVPAALDDCPCGHDENEHVHYCSAITEDGDSCNCTQEYARLSHQSEDA